MEIEITRFNERNYLDFFKEHKNPSAKNLIQGWLEKKKRTLPDYKAFGFDDKGNIFFKFLLEQNESWVLVKPEDVQGYYEDLYLLK